MAIFDALDGPHHATLRRAVFARRLRGWGLTLVGLIGLGTVLLAARTISRWERRTGRVLLSVDGGLREFYAR